MHCRHVIIDYARNKRETHMPLNQTWLARLPKKSGEEETDCQAKEGCLEKDSPITPGTIVVRGRVERHKISWHPECWLGVFIPLLEAAPYNPKGPGRKPLDLTDDQRRERKLIQNKYGSFNQRISRYQQKMREEAEENRPTTYWEILVQRILVSQDLLWWEIQDVGGAPDSWKVPEGGGEFLREKAEYLAQKD